MQPLRHLDLDGAHNVRDLGGYETVDGRRTRWKTFLRSDGMHRLTAADQEKLLRYGVRTVIDLRRTEEVRSQPNVFADSDSVAYLRRNLWGDDGLSNASDSIPDLDQAQQMALSYVRSLDIRRDNYRDALAALASPGALPVIFHCTAGKDRTGIVAALILANAGVADDAIVEDYALSGRYIFQSYLNARDEGSSELDQFIRVETWQEYQGLASPPRTMELTLKHLNDRYGGVPGYLRAIGLADDQIESLRAAAVE